MPHLDFSFATDPYLPLEARYELTRKCLEVCVRVSGAGRRNYKIAARDARHRRSEKA